MNEYLNHLRETQAYNDLINEVNKQKPVIPVYDHSIDNTEEWKAKSNMIKGFELAMVLMGDSNT